MTETLKPASEDQVLEAIRWAVAEETPLELVGRGTKRGFGRPVQAAHALDLSGLAGIEIYEPEELVLTALPGTPMAEIEAALAARGQALAFEPADLGPLYGGPAGVGTLGGPP
jgi:glycolate oxidase FAD binding subunit